MVDLPSLPSRTALLNPEDEMWEQSQTGISNGSSIAALTKTIHHFHLAPAVPLRYYPFMQSQLKSQFQPVNPYKCCHFIARHKYYPILLILFILIELISEGGGSFNRWIGVGAAVCTTTFELTRYDKLLLRTIIQEFEVVYLFLQLIISNSANWLALYSSKEMGVSDLIANTVVQFLLTPLFFLADAAPTYTRGIKLLLFCTITLVYILIIFGHIGISLTPNIFKPFETEKLCLYSNDYCITARSLALSSSINMTLFLMKGIYTLIRHKNWLVAPKINMRLVVTESDGMGSNNGIS